MSKKRYKNFAKVLFSTLDSSTNLDTKSCSNLNRTVFLKRFYFFNETHTIFRVFKCFERSTMQKGNIQLIVVKVFRDLCPF